MIYYIRNMNTNNQNDIEPANSTENYKNNIAEYNKDGQKENQIDE